MPADTDIASYVSEYERIVRDCSTPAGPDEENLVTSLVVHDWTKEGAQTILQLANDYGAFVLRNALALEIALGKEDGDLQL